MHRFTAHIASQVAALGIIAALVGCAASPGADASGTSTPTPSATPVIAATASASASASPAETPDDATAPVFQNVALATVRVNGLNLRADHSTTAPVVVDVNGLFSMGGNVQLDAGQHVFVISSAIWADGRWWLRIAVDRVGARVPVVVGWVAAGTRADPWVEEGNAWCPGPGPSLPALIKLSGLERLGCYASSRITFPAYRAILPPDAGLGGACEPAPGHPAWLVCDNINYNWVNPDGSAVWAFLLHFDPARGITPTGLTPEGEANPKLQISGHFDDRAATTCATPVPPTTNEDVARWLTCSTLFVVEQVS